MRYQRTQIYLQPEAHRLLTEEARGRGLSLTGLLREIVTLHVRERVEAYRPRGLEALIGAAGEGMSTDVSRQGGLLLNEALEARLSKKLGRPVALRRQAHPSKGRRGGRSRS